MDRYLAVQRIGDGMIAVAVPLGLAVLWTDDPEAGIWITVVFVVVGTVVSYLGQVRNLRRPKNRFP